MPEYDGYPITSLPVASTVNSSDVFPGVQGQVTKKYAASALLAYLESEIDPANIGAVSADAVGVAEGVASLDANGKVPSAQLPTIPSPSDAAPQSLGTAAAGSSGDYSRADHIHEMPSASDVGALAVVGTISLSATWSGSGPYAQRVTVTGPTITEKSKVDLQPDATQLAALIAAGVKSLTIENNAGVLMAYAIGGSTSTAMTLQCTVEETV